MGEISRVKLFGKLNPLAYKAIEGATVFYKLLGRVVVAPYYPLSDEMLGNIVRLQLGRIARRVQDNHGVPFEYDDDVVKLIIARCTELESGGRMIDALLTNTVLPVVSEEFLNRMVQGRELERVAISVADGEFAYSYD